VSVTPSKTGCLHTYFFFTSKVKSVHYPLQGEIFNYKIDRNKEAWHAVAYNGSSSINQMRSSQVLSRHETRFINSRRVPSVISSRKDKRKKKQLLIWIVSCVQKHTQKHGTIKEKINYTFVGCQWRELCWFGDTCDASHQNSVIECVRSRCRWPFSTISNVFWNLSTPTFLISVEPCEPRWLPTWTSQTHVTGKGRETK